MRIERISPRDLLRIAQMALAAGAAWELALQLPNHGRPFFAPIAAVIALGAERGRRGRQAMTMMVGVAVGILFGAGVVAVVGTGWWQLVVAVAVALVVTSAAGGGPLLRNQAAASAVLIVALHTPGQNVALQRLVDALIGGGIAIVLAQLLFPIDPVRHVLDEALLLRNRVAEALDRAGRALEAADRGGADAARAPSPPAAWHARRARSRRPRAERVGSRRPRGRHRRRAPPRRRPSTVRGGRPGALTRRDAPHARPGREPRMGRASRRGRRWTARRRRLPRSERHGRRRAGPRGTCAARRRGARIRSSCLSVTSPMASGSFMREA